MLMNKESKGFITIATGDKYYYQLAANLLASYRYKTKHPYPFAIIAEEENEYTSLFDDVVIVKNPARSFMDKFLLLRHCPYDETIFFDADIIAYSDLNQYWEIFKGATDFSSIGKNYDLNQDGAWYDIEGIGEFGKEISYKVQVHMGVCYVRKSESLDKLYRDCERIIRCYDGLTIKMFSSSKDEVTMGIAMPMNNMRVVDEQPEYIAALPSVSNVKASLLNNTLKYTSYWGTRVESGGLLIHFGTEHTREPLYKFEVECLNHLINRTTDTVIFKIRYCIGTRWISLKIMSEFRKLTALGKHVLRKIK